MQLSKACHGSQVTGNVMAVLVSVDILLGIPDSNLGLSQDYINVVGNDLCPIYSGNGMYALSWISLAKGFR